MKTIACSILLSSFAFSYASAQTIPHFLVPITQAKNGQSIADVESKLGPPLLSCKPSRKDDKQAFTQAWTDFYLKSEMRVYLRSQKATNIGGGGQPSYSFLNVIYFDGKVISVTANTRSQPSCMGAGDWR